MSTNLDLIILKYITTNKNCALEFVSTFSDSKLFETNYWLFSSEVCKYIKSYKDVPTINILVEKNPKSEQYLKNVWQELETINVDPKEYRYNIDKFKARFAQKELQFLKESINSDNINKSLGDIKRTIQNVEGLKNQNAIEHRTAKENLSNFTEKFMMKRKDPNFDPGLKTHFKYLDWAIGGGLKSSVGDLLLICAESGVGKSLMLSSISAQMWCDSPNPESIIDNFDVNNLSNYKGANITFFSLEMPYENCFNRFLAKISGLNYKRLEKGSLNKEELKKLKKTLDFIDKFPYHFDIIDIPYTTTCAELEVELEKAKLKYKPDCIVVDYCQLMNPNHGTSQGEQDWLAQGEIVKELRELIRVNKDLVGMSAIQLNRRNTSSKDPLESIGLHRLSRSSGISHTATVIAQIYSHPSNEELFASSDIFLIKNRNGPKGKFSVIKNFACSSFVDNPPDIPEDMEPEDFISDICSFDDISDDLDNLD